MKIVRDATATILDSTMQADLLKRARGSLKAKRAELRDKIFLAYKTSNQIGLIL